MVVNSAPFERTTTRAGPPPCLSMPPFSVAITTPPLRNVQAQSKGVVVVLPWVAGGVGASHDVCTDRVGATALDRGLRAAATGEPGGQEADGEGQDGGLWQCEGNQAPFPEVTLCRSSVAQLYWMAA